MINKLKWQFVLINMFLVTLVVVTSFTYINKSFHNELKDKSYNDLNAGFVFHIKANSEDVSPTMLPKSFVINKNDTDKGPENDHFNNTFYVTIDKDNNVTFFSSRSQQQFDDDYLKTLVDETLETNKTSGELHDYNLRYVIDDRYNDETEGVRLIGYADTSYENMVLTEQRTTLYFIGALVLFLFFIISVVLSSIITKPIQKSWEQQQQFVSDVSHELKTPTAVILANTSIVLSSPDLNENRKWIQYIEVEAKRMKKLVEDLLFLTKSDYDSNTVVLSSVNLSDTVFETTLPFEAVAFESNKNITLETDIDSNINIEGDQNQIKQLTSILLDNAIKYSLDDGPINISLKTDGNKAVLKVNNMSEPIPKDELNNIFDRFYKVDKSRTRTDNSYGLGLPIAKEIVNAHKGKITVKSDSVNGTTFKVVFPLLD